MECSCIKCGYEWYSRLAKPVLCPKCKTKYWEKQRKAKKGKVNDVLGKRSSSKIFIALMGFKNFRTQTELAGIMGNEQSNISKIISNLLALGYLKNRRELDMDRLVEEFLNHTRGKYSELIKIQKDQKEFFLKEKMIDTEEDMDWLFEMTNREKTARHILSLTKNKKEADIDKKQIGSFLEKIDKPQVIFNPSKDFKGFLKRDLRDFFHYSYTFNPVEYDRKTPLEIFDLYIKAFVGSFNNLKWSFASKPYQIKHKLQNDLFGFSIVCNRIEDNDYFSTELIKVFS